MDKTIPYNDNEKATDEIDELDDTLNYEDFFSDDDNIEKVRDSVITYSFLLSYDNSNINLTDYHITWSNNQLLSWLRISGLK